MTPHSTYRRLRQDPPHGRVGADLAVPPERQERRGRGHHLGQGGEVEDRAERRPTGRALEDTAAAVQHDGGRAREDAGGDALVEERLEAGGARHPTRFCFRAR